MFFVWSVALDDLLPAVLTMTLIVGAHRWSRTPRAFHAWSRALVILGAQVFWSPRC